MRQITETPKIVILSAELSTETEFFNLLRTNRLLNMIRDINLPFGVVEGYYKGVKENSVLVEIKNELDVETLLDFAKNFNQESILYSDENRESCLYICDNGLENPEMIGKLQAVSELEAKKLDSYTYVNGAYYICKK
jgi:hypothetical protein